MIVRIAPVATSLLIHLGVAGMIALAPGWTAVPERVIILELTEAPAPPVPAERPKPAAPDRRPLTLPRPIQPPKADTLPPPPVAKPAPEPPAPMPSPAPSVPASPEPTVAAAPAPAVTASAPPPSPAPGAATATDRFATAPASSTSALSTSAVPGPGPAVAAIPRDTITQAAAPRGGYQYRPSYPASARRAGVQGTTMLSVFVTADGRVSDVQVKQSAGHPDLDQAAADAVRRWRFEPARRGTEAVAMWVLLPVEFRLR